jgi:hypothetical protein
LQATALAEFSHQLHAQVQAGQFPDCGRQYSRHRGAVVGGRLQTEFFELRRKLVELPFQRLIAA